MRLKRSRAVLIGLAAAMLAAAPKPEATSEGVGIVVEAATPAYDAAKAGIQSGDILTSWERAANPPANPTPASGLFRSPFDVLEVYFEQAPRAGTMTLGLVRDGKTTPVTIAQYPWRLETRPAFSAKWLTRYEKGRLRIEQGDLPNGLDDWRLLARDLSAANEHVDAAWLWSRVGMRLSGNKEPDAALAAINQALVTAGPRAGPTSRPALGSEGRCAARG
jgi:hypothetical protein